MITVTMHGPYIDGWTFKFEGQPAAGDSLRIDGRDYRVVRREWRTELTTLSLHLTVELA